MTKVVKQRHPDEIKHCEQCGELLFRKRTGKGVLESNLHFRKRKFCNRTCMSRSFTGRNLTEDPSWYTAHKRARLICKDRECSECGSDSNIDIHHKDGDWKNNAIDNLEALCRGCHIKSHRGGRTCSICDPKHKGRGYCEKHLQRFKKYGDPRMTKYGLRD